MYESVINTRYKSPLLSPIWSTHHKIFTMRQLWISLAKHQKDLGVESISEDGIQQMIQQQSNIDLAKIQEYENQLKHDIMAHIHAYGDLCPLAKKFIHLGATSNFINDNTDMILIHQSLPILYNLSIQLFYQLKKKSIDYGSFPTIAYTHLQRGQLISYGKRFAMWNADLRMDIEKMREMMRRLPFRGMKGTVGSEDTLLRLMKGDHEKCHQLNERLAQEFGFENLLVICGQTYSRKWDLEIIHILSGMAQSLYKMMNDIRLLSSKNELFESFSEKQIGSSAMPYKKNPITCEKICSLARLIINQEINMQQTYVNQWLERTLDDSAIKRIVYPETFLLLEHILTESIKVIKNLHIHRENIERSVEEHFQYILCEEIILQGVKMGYDRQLLHEKIRVLTTNGNLNYHEDPDLHIILESNTISMNPFDYIGRCREQIEEFYETCNIEDGT